MIKCVLRLQRDSLEVLLAVLRKTSRKSKRDNDYVELVRLVLRHTHGNQIVITTKYENVFFLHS